MDNAEIGVPLKSVKVNTSVQHVKISGTNIHDVKIKWKEGTENNDDEELLKLKWLVAYSFGRWPLWMVRMAG